MLHPVGQKKAAYLQVFKWAINLQGRKYLNELMSYHQINNRLKRNPNSNCRSAENIIAGYVCQLSDQPEEGREHDRHCSQSELELLIDWNKALRTAVLNGSWKIPGKGACGKGWEWGKSDVICYYSLKAVSGPYWQCAKQKVGYAHREMKLLGLPFASKTCPAKSTLAKLQLQPGNGSSSGIAHNVKIEQAALHVSWCHF